MAGSVDFEKRVALRKAIRVHMDAIGRKILVMSGKGGVGKTTVAVGLARALASFGLSAGVLDTDLHGPNVAKALGVDVASSRSAGEPGAIVPVAVSPGLSMAGIDLAMEHPEDPVIWRGPMKHAAINDLLSRVVWGPLDFLLIDSPPGSGDEQLAVVQAIPELTGAIIVTTGEPLSLLDARRSIAFCRRMGIAVIGVVENMSVLACPHCGQPVDVFSPGGGQRMALSSDAPFLGSVPLVPGPDKAPMDAVFVAIAGMLAQGLRCSGIATEVRHG